MKIRETRTLTRSIAQSLFATAAWVVIFVGFAGFAEADENTEPLDGAFIEEAVVTPAKIGGTAFLRFKVSNFGSSPIVLSSITSSASKEAVVIMTMPDGATHIAPRLMVREEETLDLASSHITIELRELRRKIVPGSTLNFSVNFNGYHLPSVVHVH